MRTPGDGLQPRTYALIAGGLLVLAVFFGISAVTSGDPDADSASDDATTSTTSAGTTTTTREIPTGVLTLDDFQPGDCVDWDDTAEAKQPAIVPCNEPHWMELAADVVVPAAPDAPYPDAATWEQLRTQLCTEPVREYQPLDPSGRFAVKAILAGPNEWNAGDRRMWCGIQVQADRVTDVAERTDERVEDQDQSWTYPAGTCLVNVFGRVDDIACTQPHEYEVIGHLEFDRSSHPTPEQWAAIRDNCEPIAEEYLDRELAAVPGVVVASGELTAEQWEAGSRRVDCQLVRVDAAGAVQTVTGSIRDGA